MRHSAPNPSAWYRCAPAGPAAAAGRQPARRPAHARCNDGGLYAAVMVGFKNGGVTTAFEMLQHRGMRRPTAAAHAHLGWPDSHQSDGSSAARIASIVTPQAPHLAVLQQQGSAASLNSGGGGRVPRAGGEPPRACLLRTPDQMQMRVRRQRACSTPADGEPLGRGRCHPAATPVFTTNSASNPLQLQP